MSEYNGWTISEQALINEYGEIGKRVVFLERTVHQLWRMFYPQIQFQEAIDRLEHMLDNEEYEEVQIKVDQLRSSLGEGVDLVGVQARLDTMLFLKEHGDEDDA